MCVEVFYATNGRRTCVEVQRKIHITLALQIFFSIRLLHVNPLLTDIIVIGGVQAHIRQRSRLCAVHIQGSAFSVGTCVTFSITTQKSISCSIYKIHTVFSFFLVFLFFENLGFSALRGEPLNPMFSLSLGRSTTCTYAYPLDTTGNK